MSDYIKREDVLAVIDKIKDGDEIDLVNARLELEDLPSADVIPKPKWIPVTERLPEEREWVLCQCRAKIRMVLRLQNGYWHQDSEHEFMKSFVTHWMPLPEPPEEE